MSIKDELKTLESEREGLNEEERDTYSKLDKLYTQKVPIVQKAEILKTRTSSLAQKLLEIVQKELECINQEIVQVEKRKEEIRKELEENKKNIFLKEENPALYIEEQSSIMVFAFLEYIEKHLEEVGLEIQKTFHIAEITCDRGDRIDTCHVPTGNIGIYDENSKNFIVSSQEFYFRKKLFTITEESHGMYCHKTEWYEDYHKKFVSFLLETLEKNYTYGELFKLTIEDSSFTLELV